MAAISNLYDTLIAMGYINIDNDVFDRVPSYELKELLRLFIFKEDEIDEEIIRKLGIKTENLINWLNGESNLSMRHIIIDKLKFLDKIRLKIFFI